MSPYGEDVGGGGSGAGDHLNSSVYGNDSSYLIGPKRDPLYIVVPMTIMYSVIFVTGVIGNSITCLVIAKHKFMHTATNYYLFSLAVSDLILLVSGLPQEMWSIWSRYPYVFGQIFCQLRGLFAEMSANATVLTITAFTAERYVAICHPFMAQSMSKLSRAVKLIVVIWLVAVLFAVPQAVQFTVAPMNDSDSTDLMQCNLRSIQVMDVELSTVSFTVSTVLFFVLPMTFITVLYVLIGLRLRRTDRLKRTVTVRSSSGEKKISSLEYRANSSSKVLKMLVAVVVAFFICWAPFHAQRLIAIFGSSQTEDVTFLHQLYGISTYVSGVLYYLSTTVNPILYHIMSLKFRTAFKETVLRCCRSSGRTSSFCGGAVIDAVGEEQRWPREPWRWRLWRRNRRRQRRRPSDSPVAATADVRRQKYRRVSGRASSSFELSADDGRLAAANGYTVTVIGPARSSSSNSSSSAGLADCWRRVLNVGGSGNAAARHRVRDNYDDDDDDDSSGPLSASRLRGGCVGGAQSSAGPVALSNWTMISDSSLRDANCDDLREELFGRGYVEAGPATYAVTCNVRAVTSATAADLDDSGTARVDVGDDYY